jgi:flagellin-like protein
MRYTETQKDDSAVSPVIGVILMVAITVILAAVIGTFVLGLGQNVQENAQAGVTFDYDGDADELVVSVTDPGNVDALYLQLSNGTTYGPDTSPAVAASAGNRTTISSASNNDAVTVLGQVNGENTTIRTYEDF